MSSCLCRPISRGACVLVKPGKCLLGIGICRQTPEQGVQIYIQLHMWGIHPHPMLPMTCCSFFSPQGPTAPWKEGLLGFPRPPLLRLPLTLPRFCSAEAVVPDHGFAVDSSRFGLSRLLAANLPEQLAEN